MRSGFLTALAVVLYCPPVVADENSPTAADCTQLHSVAYTSKRSFYRRSGAGTLARMPNVVVARDLVGAASFDAFVESGTYTLKRDRPEAWFVINHRLDNAQPDATYIGVLVVKALRRDQQSPLWLYRNSGWTPATNASYPLPFHTLEDFFARQGTDSTLDAFQAEFGIWHGKPTENSPIDSWANRREWHRSPSSCGAFQRFDVNSTTSALVTAHLIGFRPTRKDDSTSPVTLKVRLSDAEAIYIATFSPASPDFSRDYTLTLTD